MVILAFLSGEVFCQAKIGTGEYKVYSDVLKEIFVSKGFEIENFTKPRTPLNFEKLTLNTVPKVPKANCKLELSDTFYLNYENLNKQAYKLNRKKITVKVASKYKQFSISLSRCYIDKDYAIVFIGIVYAPLNGNGKTYIAKYDKTTGTWKIVAEIGGWIS